ncbi:CRISPR-associated protein Cas4 [Candidatus Woesearchaeota archaeon]|nr:CRISPR-associated protein Cas4 [Candidatus Woesearchaeota archaeon]
MKIHVSMLSSYLYCPRKLFLQQVLALEELPKESILLGTLRHEVYNSINKQEEKIAVSIAENSDYNKILSSYIKKYSKTLREKIIKNSIKLKAFNLKLADIFKDVWGTLSLEAESRAKNIFNFVQQHNIYGKELWEKLTPKIVSELRIDSETLELIGIIDRIEMHENNYIPIELKTGKAPKEGIWHSHRIQLAAYALLLEEKFQKPINKAMVYYLDAREIRQITINPFMKDEIMDLINKVKELLKSHYVPAYCENRNKCAGCSLKETCYSDETITVLLSEINKN